MLDPQPHISPEELDTGLRRLVNEAAYSSATTALTTGVILTAFALHLGASNSMIGLLAAIPFLTQFGQAPAILLVERLRARKRIAVLSSVIGRSMLGVMALLPLLPLDFGLWGLVVATFVLCAMGAVGGCAWNGWLRDLAPEESMGAVIARRTMLATVASLIAGLIAAFGLQWSRPGEPSRDLIFVILYGIGCVSGLYSAWIVSHIPEPLMPERHAGGATLLQLLRSPFADRNFVRLIRFLSSWQFAINLATPFFTVFLVRQLGYGMSTVMLLSITSQIANVIALRGWGSLSDRFSNKSVLLVAAPAYIICILAMIGASQISGPTLRTVWLFALHLFMGASVAGVTLGTTNIALKLSPKGAATAYVATSALVSSLAAGIAPIIGGLFADYFAGRRLELLIRWVAPGATESFRPLQLSNWDFYFLIAGVFGLYALHRLSLVRETGEIDRREMVREVIARTRTAVQNFSSVSGIKAVTEFPSALLRDLQVRERFLRVGRLSAPNANRPASPDKADYR